MARQHTLSPSLKSTAGTALTGLGILVLFGSLDWPVAQLGSFFCRAAGEGLGLLPCIVQAAWQAMQAFTFDHHRFLECLLHSLLSSSPVLRVVAAVI
jgi:hypothetical protein